MEFNPQRHLSIEGTQNIRDLGGYPTKDGCQTRWGRFLRSDGLHSVTATGQAQLLAMGLRTIVDLRRSSELTTAPSVFSGSKDLAYHHLDMIGEGTLEEVQPLSDGVDRIAHTYCQWLENRQEAVCRILGTLAGSNALPALYNCAAGKDRTGVISALLLSVADVTDEVIADDYALSARFLLDRHHRELNAAGKPNPEYTEQDYRRDYVPPEAMCRVLRHVHEQYGGAASYMHHVGLENDQIELLRAGLLTD